MQNLPTDCLVKVESFLNSPRDSPYEKTYLVCNKSLVILSSGYSKPSFPLMMFRASRP